MVLRSAYSVVIIRISLPLSSLSLSTSDAVSRHFLFHADVASATSMQTALSLPFLLDALVPMLAAAIDGDPSTEA